MRIPIPGADPNGDAQQKIIDFLTRGFVKPSKHRAGRVGKKSKAKARRRGTHGKAVRRRRLAARRAEIKARRGK